MNKGRGFKTMFVSVFYNSDQWHQILGSIIKPMFDVNRTDAKATVLINFDSGRGDSLNLSCFSEDYTLLKSMLFQFTNDCQGYMECNPSFSSVSDIEPSLFRNFENNRIYYKVNPFTPYFFTLKNGKFLPAVWQRISELMIAEVIDSKLNRESLRTVYLYVVSILFKIDTELFNEFVKHSREKERNFQNNQFEEMYRRMSPTLLSIDSEASSLCDQGSDLSEGENSILGIANQLSIFVSEVRASYDSPTYWLGSTYSYILFGMQKILGLTEAESVVCLQLLYRIKQKGFE